MAQTGHRNVWAKGDIWSPYSFKQEETERKEDANAELSMK